MSKLSCGPVIGAPGKDEHERFDGGIRASWVAESDRFWWSFHPIVIWLELIRDHPNKAGDRRGTPARH